MKPIVDLYAIGEGLKTWHYCEPVNCQECNAQKTIMVFIYCWKKEIYPEQHILCDNCTEKAIAKYGLIDMKTQRVSTIQASYRFTIPTDARRFIGIRPQYIYTTNVTDAVYNDSAIYSDTEGVQIDDRTVLANREVFGDYNQKVEQLGVEIGKPIEELEKQDNQSLLEEKVVDKFLSQLQQGSDDEVKRLEDENGDKRL